MKTVPFLSAFTCKALLLFVALLPLDAIELSDDVNLRGFASINGILNLSEDTDRELLNGSVVTLEEDDMYTKNSRAGLQLDATLNSAFDVMVQGIYIKERARDDYEARLEWAMLGYRFGNDYALHVGKMKIAAMDGAQNRYIGYSYLWIDPQVSFTGINGFENFYGVDVSKKGYIGALDYEWQLNGGKLQNHERQADEGNYLYSASAKLFYENAMLRLGAGELNFDHYGRTGELISKDETITFLSAEMQYMYDAFEFSGGYSAHRTDAIPEANKQYLSLAYRYDLLTPYLLYTRKEVTGIPKRHTLASTVPTPNGSNAAKETFVDDRVEHYIFGARYDILDGVALKGEYDQMLTKHPSQAHRRFDMINLTLDMVF